jgi:hypothetical protein
MLAEGAPDAFKFMDQKYKELLLNWRPMQM